ncbi:MAG: 3'(2') 5'-bisphosphate nucleotidase [bacterium]|nr:MAG: 3'(2') 5'-bisphosphate nucleotidase [bacterium]
METYIQEKEVAKQIALRAGQVILEYYSKNVSVTMKSGDEPVTEVDHAANNFIIENLQKAFPEDLIISEERADDPKRLTAKRFWLVDPLDGTKEFLAHNGEFSVMIGLVEWGKPVVGAVFQPTENRLWWGDRTKSFMLDNGVETTLQVSDRTDFQAMRAVVSRSHRSALLDQVFAKFNITNEIISGSGGIKIGLISQAKAELMASASAGYKIWDICAPEAILIGAGGIVTDFAGQPIDYQNKEQRAFNGILASNGKCHSDLVLGMKDLITLPFSKK